MIICANIRNFIFDFQINSHENRNLQPRTASRGYSFPVNFVKNKGQSLTISAKINLTCKFASSTGSESDNPTKVLKSRHHANPQPAREAGVEQP